MVWGGLVGLCLTTALSSAGVARGNADTILHSFGGGPGDGLFPEASPTLVGSTLFGTTYSGGASNAGTVFQINTDGSGFKLVHSFTGGVSDGSGAYGTLLNVGSTLFGTTYGGGAASDGTVFRVNTDGSGYAVLHSFAGGMTDGNNPFTASLVSVGGALYGTARYGGASDGGVVFRLNADGTGYSILHSFTPTTDGSNPISGLVAIGSTLYGTTSAGTPTNGGAIYSINTDGSGFGIVHDFTASTDGAAAHGELIVSSGTLYGTTASGITGGTVFSVTPDGSSYKVLHQFAGNPDGKYPEGSLYLNGSTLYGLTDNGGGSNLGTAFQLHTDGSGYSVIHTFTGGNSDGDFPQGGLVGQGNNLFGFTFEDGSAGYGTVFEISTPEPSTAILTVVPAAVLWGRRRSRLIERAIRSG